MERFDTARLRAFVRYLMHHDPQILANRREARALYAAALDDEGDFSISADKADKLETFLTLNDLQVHGAGNDGTVSIYAFTKILAELRRRLRDNMESPASSGAATPRTDEGSRAPSGRVIDAPPL